MNRRGRINEGSREGEYASGFKCVSVPLNRKSERGWRGASKQVMGVLPVFSLPKLTLKLNLQIYISIVLGDGAFER
jgi:hypothetical protein